MLRLVQRFGAVSLALLAFWLATAAFPAEDTASAPALTATATNAPAAAAAALKPEPSKPHTSALTFGLDGVAALQTRFLGQPLWKGVAALIYLILAMLSSRLVDWLVLRWLKRWAARTDTKYDDLLIEIAHGPLKVVIFVILLHIGLQLIDYGPVFNEYVSKGLRLVVAWSITYMVLKAVDIVLGIWRQRAGGESDNLFNDHLFPVIRRGVRWLLITAAVLLTADNLGLKITSILAGLSIGGLALGLAAQDTVANLFGAVAIFLDKPFKVGDRIKVDSYEGTVEAIGIRSTRLRNLDGHVVTIPNKTMGNASITNVSARPHIRSVINLGLTYDTPPAKVQEAVAILNEVYRKHPNTGDLLISFNEFAASSLNLQVVHWWNNPDYKAYLAGMQALNLEIKQRFDAAGLSFAFPSQTLYVRQDSAWSVAPAHSPGAPDAVAKPA